MTCDLSAIHVSSSLTSLRAVPRLFLRPSPEKHLSLFLDLELLLPADSET